MKTLCANGNTVDHWFDQRTRSSVTQVKDADGDQIGPAAYSGNRTTARATRLAAIAANGGKAPRKNI